MEFMTTSFSVEVVYRWICKCIVSCNTLLWGSDVMLIMGASSWTFIYQKGNDDRGLFLLMYCFMMRAVVKTIRAHIHRFRLAWGFFSLWPKIDLSKMLSIYSQIANICHPASVFDLDFRLKLCSFFISRNFLNFEKHTHAYKNRSDKVQT